MCLSPLGADDVGAELTPERAHLLGRIGVEHAEVLQQQTRLLVLAHLARENVTQKSDRARRRESAIRMVMREWMCAHLEEPLGESVDGIDVLLLELVVRRE